MSIAVLRTFINKRQEEHEAFLSKKAKVNKFEGKSDAVASENVLVRVEPETTNGVHDGDAHELKPEDASCSTIVEPSNNVGGKAHRELKPPRVLEVFYMLVDMLNLSFILMGVSNSNGLY